MEKNLKLILPLKMENLEYMPYLGILNFENKRKNKYFKK